MRVSNFLTTAMNELTQQNKLLQKNTKHAYRKYPLHSRYSPLFVLLVEFDIVIPRRNRVLFFAVKCGHSKWHGEHPGLHRQAAHQHWVGSGFPYKALLPRSLNFDHAILVYCCLDWC